jgi:FixJ family two-component response regulator
LRVARDDKIDAALLDLNIDGGRTDDVALILHERNIPFAFVTGLGRGSVPAGFAEASIVEKPFRDEALLDVVRRLAKVG